MDPRHFYLRRGRDVIQHLLELATGLKSMILGEAEIMGQIESAVQLAAKCEITPDTAEGSRV
jgi:glutamyl-tRNA reductase